MFDCHLHTEVSTDSKMKIEAAIEKAKNLNLGLVLTEHMDINYPIKDHFIFDAQDYFDGYSRYRNETLLLGVEIGMKEDCVSEAKALVSQNPFDQVIGSVHLVNGVDIYLEEFYINRNKKEIYEEYLYSILNNLKKFDFVDTLGHIDYICRYARVEDKELYYEEFHETIDTILKKVIENEKAIEINTKRLENKIASKNLISIYKRYYELGGRIITIGSDAHNPDDIGRGILLAYDIANQLNLKPVYFKNRKPQYVF